MDLSAAGPDGTSVPVYDEDPEESFIGPVGLANFFAEESDAAERDDEDYGEDEYYDGEGTLPAPLETSTSQRTGLSDPGHVETVSGHTHGPKVIK